MPAPKTANTEAARAASLASRAAKKRVREIRAAKILLNNEGYLVLDRASVIETLGQSFADGYYRVRPDPDTACAEHDDAHLGHACPDLTI